MSTQSSKISILWLWTMAWRDSRRSRSRLLLFISSIILGIAALVAINSFRYNLLNDMDSQAKELLGADLMLNSNQQLMESAAKRVLDSVSRAQARECSFASMLVFSKNNQSRLVQIRAIDGAYPFYGSIETAPREALASFGQGRYALLDQTLMLQFDAKTGDSVRIGNTTFVIAGQLVKVPGQSDIMSTAAPSVHIPLSYLPETGLMQKGSRIAYKYYYQFSPGYQLETLMKAMKPQFEKERLGVETADTRKAALGRSFENLSRFLNLVGFVALLLGCVGVASSVHIYVKEKLPYVAVLRCLGTSGWQAFMIYLLQILSVGFTGSVLGAALGSLIQSSLPVILKDFLPISVDFSISWMAILQGILLGSVIAVLFAMLSLLRIRKVSPLRTLRSSYEEDISGRDPLRLLIFVLIALFIFGFSYWQMGVLRDAGFFTAGISLAFLILAGIAQGIMWLTRRFFPVSWSYVWRQSLANLYRPNNQTLILLISVGLGTALMTTLYFIQSLLINQVAMSGGGNQPNMVLFDIQTGQKDAVNRLARQFDLPVIQEVPVITMRLEGINGRSRSEILKDSTNKIPEWALSREYRVTYRDSLISSETLTEGSLQKQAVTPGDSIFISMDGNYARNMGLKIGDRVTFDVQGAIVETFVGSFRKVDWNRVQTNFLVVFPRGVLEEAPQFHVLITRVSSKQVSARFQQAVVSNYPNISVIDLGLILSTVDEILGRVSFVIRFMALFSIITGLIVLVGSVLVSKYQRIQESVLLRTLGASRRQIFAIAALEYFFLGSLASLSGILLALLGSWGLAYFTFRSGFVPDLLPGIVVFVAITLLTMLIGLFNSRSIVNKPPLEVLRSEL